jgi:hypothetical protein
MVSSDGLVTMDSVPFISVIIYYINEMRGSCSFFAKLSAYPHVCQFPERIYNWRERKEAVA